MPGRDYFGLFYVCRKKGFSALEQHMRGSQFAHSGTRIKRIFTGCFEEAVCIYLAGGSMGNYAVGLLRPFVLDVHIASLFTIARFHGGGGGSFVYRSITHSHIVG